MSRATTVVVALFRCAAKQLCQGYTRIQLILQSEFVKVTFPDLTTYFCTRDPPRAWRVAVQRAADSFTRSTYGKQRDLGGHSNDHHQEF
jgi:hypothetical protein